LLIAAFRFNNKKSLKKVKRVITNKTENCIYDEDDINMTADNDSCN